MYFIRVVRFLGEDWLQYLCHVDRTSDTLASLVSTRIRAWEVIVYFCSLVEYLLGF